jgi:hypothetical protein
VTGQRVRSHYCPVDVFNNILEEGSAVAVLQPFEDFANAFVCNCHLSFSSVFLIFHLQDVCDNAPELLLLTGESMTASAAAASSEAFIQIE